MEKTKVISVRLHQSTIDKIEAMSGNSRVWKRNTIISEILAKMVTYADPKDLWELIKYYPNPLNKPEIDIKIRPR